MTRREITSKRCCFSSYFSTPAFLSSTDIEEQFLYHMLTKNDGRIENHGLVRNSSLVISRYQAWRAVFTVLTQNKAYCHKAKE